MSIISSYTGFQPLTEVWLGDCYPKHFFQDFDNQSQDFFSEITERTQQDLSRLHNKLTELGVNVVRPEFGDIEQYLDEDNNLIKPPITPRDWALTLGETLLVLPQYATNHVPFQSAIDRYRNNGQQVRVLDRSRPDPWCYVPFPSTVRVGRDIYVDCSKHDPQAYEWFTQAIQDLAPDHRVHVTHTGDHSDGCFCPIAPGHIFSTHYRKRYSQTFPDWDVFFLTDTTRRRQYNGHNGNWWVDGLHYQVYNPLITQYAQHWLGDSQETVFEVNMLVIDEKNIICIAEDDAACKRLEQLGITPHVVDFTTRGFWDGGIHCLTLDIHRQGTKLDYWPNRGPNGIYYYEQ